MLGAVMVDMRKRNLLAAIVLIAVGTGYAILAHYLPTRHIENATGPSFFPLVVVSGFLILSAALLVRSILPTVSYSVTVQSSLVIPASRYGAGLAAAVVYLAALPYLGFIAANIPLFAVLMILYGERRPARVISGSVVITLLVFFLFREVFQILLPAGILGDLV